MIDIIKINEIKSFDNSLINTYSVVFFGEAIDDRTDYTKLSILNSNVPNLVNIKWNNDKKIFIINEEEYSYREYRDLMSQYCDGKILIDATSLDFPEITYILNEYYSKNILIDICYIEPQGYLEKKSISPEDTDFDLSTNQKTFSNLPFFGFPNLGASTSIVAPLGFEPMRLGQLLTSDDGRDYHSINGLIAIPAYKAGWENRSIKSNLRHFERSSDNSLLLHPSSNPYEIYQQVKELQDAYKSILLAPLGTKPSTIALSIYLVNNFRNNTKSENVSAVFDFPLKNNKRTFGVDKIHLFKIKS